MDDPSIDAYSKGRGEVLAELTQLGINITQSSTVKLQTQLRNALMERHPIHEWLTKLDQDNLKRIYHPIYPSSPRVSFDRMRKAIATYYFKNFPKAPLSHLICNSNGLLYSSENLTQLLNSKYKKEKSLEDSIKSPTEQQNHLKT